MVPSNGLRHDRTLVNHVPFKSAIPAHEKGSGSIVPNTTDFRMFAMKLYQASTTDIRRYTYRSPGYQGIHVTLETVAVATQACPTPTVANALTSTSIDMTM